MGDLTKNISRHELACNCGCGFDTADIDTVLAVQDCCDHFAEQLHKDRVVLDITSGCRCEAYNREVGGSPESQHPKARAIDFVIRGVANVEVQSYLKMKYPDQWGIGSYSNFTHLDTRTNGPARW